MNEVAYTHCRAILEDQILEDATVVCRMGHIASIQSTSSFTASDVPTIDLQGNYLSPGYIDLHVHGAAGHDFMDGTLEAVLSASRCHLRHGTTTIFPTTTTGSKQELTKMIQACQEVANMRTKEIPRIGGIHLYGPYFAESKRGCHGRDGCRAPLAEEYDAYFASGMIRIATCAAELPGALAFYRQAHTHGCLVTCGHSDASWNEMRMAFDAGMRHVDHFWCAMSNVSSVRARLGVPMQGSMLEFVLGNDEMSTEVIADGQHLAPELLDFAYRMKGSHRLCLVTDANRAMEMPPGEYRFGHFETGSLFHSDGKVGWANPNSLASSVVGMDHMVRVMYRQTGAPLHEVIRMASLTPAERVGIESETGSIAVGKRADLLVLDEDLQLVQVLFEP